MSLVETNIFFIELYVRNRIRMIRFAKSYLVENPHLAEDIVEDAFVYLWENRHKVDLEDNALGYIFKIVRSRCLNELRKMNRYSISTSNDEIHEWDRNMRIASLQSDNVDKIFFFFLQAIVNKTIMTLPEKTRRIFCLKKYDGKKYSEIAMIMGISRKGVEFHMSKALKRLRKELDDYLTK